MESYYYVYIMAGRSGNLYTGVTSNLSKRVYEHKKGLVGGFTQRYRICRLVYFETFRDIRVAIEREKKNQGMDAGKASCAYRGDESHVGRLGGRLVYKDFKENADPSLRSG